MFIKTNFKLVKFSMLDFVLVEWFVMLKRGYRQKNALYSHFKAREQHFSLIPEMLCGPGLYFGEQKV